MKKIRLLVLAGAFLLSSYNKKLVSMNSDGNNFVAERNIRNKFEKKVYKYYGSFIEKNNILEPYHLEKVFELIGKAVARIYELDLADSQNVSLFETDLCDSDALLSSFITYNNNTLKDFVLKEDTNCYDFIEVLAIAKRYFKPSSWINFQKSLRQCYSDNDNRKSKQKKIFGEIDYSGRFSSKERLIWGSNSSLLLSHNDIMLILNARLFLKNFFKKFVGCDFDFCLHEIVPKNYLPDGHVKDDAGTVFFSSSLPTEDGVERVSLNLGLQKNEFVNWILDFFSYSVVLLTGMEGIVCNQKLGLSVKQAKKFFLIYTIQKYRKNSPFESFAEGVISRACRELSRINRSCSNREGDAFIKVLLDKYVFPYSSPDVSVYSFDSLKSVNIETATSSLVEPISSFDNTAKVDYVLHDSPREFSERACKNFYQDFCQSIKLIPLAAFNRNSPTLIYNLAYVINKYYDLDRAPNKKNRKFKPFTWLNDRVILGVFQAPVKKMSPENVSSQKGLIAQRVSSLGVYLVNSDNSPNHLKTVQLESLFTNAKLTQTPPAVFSFESKQLVTPLFEVDFSNDDVTIKRNMEALLGFIKELVKYEEIMISDFKNLAGSLSDDAIKLLFKNLVMFRAEVPVQTEIPLQGFTDDEKGFFVKINELGLQRYDEDFPGLGKSGVPAGQCGDKKGKKGKSKK